VKSISGPRDLAQIAWNFINDSLRTTICLQYAPRCVAAAAAQMASEYLESKQRPFPLPAHPKGSNGEWYGAFQVRESTVRTIVEAIKQMYDDNRGAGGSLPLQNGASEQARPPAAAADSRAAGSSPSGRDAGGGRAKADGSHRPAEGVKREVGSSTREAARGTPRDGGIKRDVTSGGQEAAVKEDGEIDDSSSVPPTKRSKEAER